MYINYFCPFFAAIIKTNEPMKTGFINLMEAGEHFENWGRLKNSVSLVDRQKALIGNRANDAKVSLCDDCIKK